MAKIIDGKALAEKHTQLLKERISQLKRKPKVVSILVGDDPASLLYSRMKQRRAKEVGVEFELRKYSTTTSWDSVAADMQAFNNDPGIDGIMIQLPLPSKFLGKRRAEDLIQAIDSKKDVDGLTGKGPLLQATVRGVLSILESEGELGESYQTVVVGGVRGMVGKGLVKALGARKEWVVGVSWRDTQLAKKTKEADILISCVGKPNLITADMVKVGAVVIDVGMDVDFKRVLEKASRITPPKGGVGPMTVISLMENVIELAGEKEEK